MREKIQLLIERGMKITAIAKEAGIPRSTFDYWFREGKELNEFHQKRLQIWIENYKKFVAEL